MLSFEDSFNAMVVLSMAYYLFYILIDHNATYLLGFALLIITLVSFPVILADVWIRNIERSKNIAYE